MIWSNLINNFTKGYFSNEDDDYQQQVKFAFTACIITCIFSFLYVVVSILIGFTPGIYMMSASTLLFLILVLLFKTKIRLSIISNLYVCFCFMSIFTCSYFSGGIDSAVTPWLVLVPMTASLLVSKIIVWIWVLICSAVVITYGLLKANNIVIDIYFDKFYLDFFYISVYIGLILITLLVNSVYETIKNTALRKLEITRKDLKHKKEIIEEKHIAITDSIVYAKRLQNAILPPISSISKYLKNYFIFYKPKEIVSGDFYWVEKIDDTILFAVADCTGHGVPGAMVSVVCNNALNRAVKEFDLIKPCEILNKTKDIVIEQFDKGHEDVKDGMDIALCSLNIKTNLLTFSGANNPLYIVRNHDRNLEEVKANRLSVGKNVKKQHFTSEELQLNKGDMLYLFSDGFADQFGGPKKKKYKYNTFKDLLLKHSTKLIAEQKLEIEKEFEQWKGDYEQIDDVCIFGLMIN